MPTVSLPTEEFADAVQVPPGVDVVIWDGTGSPPDAAERIELFVARYDAGPPPAEAFGALPALRVVQVLSAGVEQWLPVVSSGVTFCNGRGVHGASTAELAVAGLLAVLRDLPTLLDAQREHRWIDDTADGVVGRRVLVLGAGDIGSRIASALRAFDAEVTVVARHARDGVRTMAEVPDLLARQDVVVVALPSTPETTGLVDAEFLGRLPDGAVLVNIARGTIVDTEALLAELSARRLRAFLDVVDPEPLPADHPLWSAPNLVLTPHVGGGTRGWLGRAAQLVSDQLRRYEAGEPLANVVDGY